MGTWATIDDILPQYFLGVIFEMTDEVVVAVPEVVLESTVVLVRKKMMDTLEKEDDFVVMEWVATERYTWAEWRNKDCCKDCFPSIEHPDKTQLLLFVVLQKL